MDWLIYLLVAALIITLAVWGADRQLCLNDVEKDLKLMLGDFMIARDLSSDQIKVHYQATVSTVKSLVRRHFKD